jgi:hypothetical protein
VHGTRYGENFGHSDNSSGREREWRLGQIHAGQRAQLRAILARLDDHDDRSLGPDVEQICGVDAVDDPHLMVDQGSDTGQHRGTDRSVTAQRVSEGGEDRWGRQRSAPPRQYLKPSWALVGAIVSSAD